MKSSRTCGMLTAILAVALLAGAAVAEEEPAQAIGKKKKPFEGQEALSRAAVAAQLALEGEQRKSPILLLAAAEILGGLEQSDRKTDGIEVKGEDDDSKPKPDLSIRHLVQQARKYAEGDDELKALVEKRLEQLSERGLIYTQGKDLEDLYVEGVHFKVLHVGVLKAGHFYELTNVLFEANKPAAIAVVGDGDGDLDLGVFDGPTEKLIGKDTDYSSVCLVQWLPSSERPHTVLVVNEGKIAERFVILANW